VIRPAGLRLASVAMEASRLARRVACGHGQASSSASAGSGIGPEEVSPFLFIWKSFAILYFLYSN
jgi:hypothetical protein